MSVESKQSAAVTGREIDNSLTYQVYYAIKREILIGKRPVGEKLNVVHLAEEYNVSRTPVIQALELLRRDELIEKLPGKRATVKPLSAREISMIYTFRKQLEPMAARMSVGVIPRQEPLALKEQVLALIEHPERLGESVHLDEQLHSMLWRYLDSPLISSLFGTINEYSVRLQAFTAYSIETASGNWQEHLDILEAVLSGDGDATAAAVERHLDRSCERLLSFCDGK